MSCYRLPLLAFILAAASMAAMSVLTAREAKGQVATSLDMSLMRPELDGDPRDPPRFRRNRRTQEREWSRFTEGGSSFSRGRGIGSTGFDSSNSERKNRPSRAARPTRQGVANSGKGYSAASAAAAPANNSDSPPATDQQLAPRQLQPAPGPIAGRFYNPVRPGAPPISPDPVTATVATTAPNLRQPPEEKPFDPPGIQVGAFTVRPAIEYIRGYDNNPGRSSGPPAGGSWFNLYTPELLAASNWERHELTAVVRGSYATFDTQHSLDRPNVEARMNARVDVTRETRLLLEGRYLLFTDYPGSPNIQVGLARLPIAMTYGSSVGIGQQFNRLDLALKGTFDRTVYNDSEFIDGTTAGNADRNFNQYGTQLRLGYEVMPGARPFLELGLIRRDYDLPFDAGGNDRASQGYYGKVGTAFAFVGKLIGEVSFGYLTRGYRDPTLERIGGWTIDSVLTWLPTPLTTVKLINTTAVTETVLQGVSGAFTRATLLQVDHAFRRWLIGTLRFGRAIDAYVGSPRQDLRYLAAAGIAYTLTRDLCLNGEYRQEWRFSNEPGNNFWAHVWLLGLRLQR
ncbi:MAG TPA: outer membrane beta-barrel protein [Xanthobacteraceae bacterium]